MPDAVEFTVQRDDPARAHAAIVASIRYAASRLGTADLVISQDATPEGWQYRVRRREPAAPRRGRMTRAQEKWLRRLGEGSQTANPNAAWGVGSFKKVMGNLCALGYAAPAGDGGFAITAEGRAALRELEQRKGRKA